VVFDRGAIGNVVAVLMCHVQTPHAFEVKTHQKDRPNTSRAIFGDDEHATWREVYRLMKCKIGSVRNEFEGIPRTEY